MAVPRRRLPRSIGRKSRWLMAGSAAAILVLAPTTAAAAAPQGATHHAAMVVHVAGAHQRWATARADRGPVSARSRMSVRVYLAGQDPAGLAKFAMAVPTPGTRNFRQYLVPAQVLHGGSSFGNVPCGLPGK